MARQGGVDQRLRSRVASGLDRARLLPAAERVREALLARRGRGGPEADENGLPLPPPRLRLLVDGRNADAGYFLAIGRQMAASIAAAAADSGVPLDGAGSILDFGCGCGRVARHWAELDGPEVHGCDYNPELVEWCQGNLPFLRASRNELEPPAPYPDASFDVVYALSVLSHLSEPLQDAWVADFRRILRPGGLLIVSVLGDAARGRLTRAEEKRFDRGELVVERPRMSGRNACTAYHPRAYVTERLLRDFAEVKPFDLGGGVLTMLQDGYAARR